MTAAHDDGVTLSQRQYRWLDRGTKLIGVALIGIGLEVGGDTIAGIALAAAGVAFGLATVFINTS